MKLRTATLLAGLLAAWPTAPRSMEVLEIHPSARKPVFTVLQDGAPPPLPSFAGPLAGPAASPISVSSRTFSGTVFDPSGTAIPRVSITIYRQSSGVAAQPHKIRSDEHGRFSVTPSSGRYTAGPSAPGFRVQFWTSEIARGAAQNPVGVKLNLGAVSESVAVAANDENH